MLCFPFFCVLFVYSTGALGGFPIVQTFLLMALVCAYTLALVRFAPYASVLQLFADCVVQGTMFLSYFFFFVAAVSETTSATEAAFYTIQVTQWLAVCMLLLMGVPSFVRGIKTIRGLREKNEAEGVVCDREMDACVFKQVARVPLQRMGRCGFCLYANLGRRTYHSFSVDPSAQAPEQRWQTRQRLPRVTRSRLRRYMYTGPR
jgi:hypothetical protein